MSCTVSENTSTGKIGVKLFRVTNINNNGYVTTATVIGEDLGDNLTVSGGTFTTMGKTYQANALQCNMNADGVATIVATFPFTSEFDNSSMTLNIDGEEMSFNLDELFENAQTIVVGDNAGAKSSGAIIVNGSKSSFPEGMEIYIDGEKATYTQIRELANDKIASVTVDRQSNKIEIFLKK